MKPVQLIRTVLRSLPARANCSVQLDTLLAALDAISSRVREIQPVGAGRNGHQFCHREPEPAVQSGDAEIGDPSEPGFTTATLPAGR